MALLLPLRVLSLLLVLGSSQQLLVPLVAIVVLRLCWVIAIAVLEGHRWRTLIQVDDPVAAHGEVHDPNMAFGMLFLLSCLLLMRCVRREYGRVVATVIVASWLFVEPMLPVLVRQPRLRAASAALQAPLLLLQVLALAPRVLPV